MATGRFVLTILACVIPLAAQFARAAETLVSYPLAVRELLDKKQWAPIEPLAEFLRRTPSGEESGEDLSGVKDAVLMRISEGSVPRPGWLRALCEIIEDPAADPVGRVYCAQYVSLLYPVFARTPAVSEEAKRARATLREALNSPDDYLSGTALLQLATLVEHHPELDRARVETEALDMLRQQRRGAPARVAALQVCARLRVVEALPLIRSLLVTAENAAESASAFHALGILGEPGDIDLLRTLPNRPILPQARDAALRSLERRWTVQT
ncbi:MAG: hypothetical protein U1E27_11710, partial [Kiritimatiellia bacterium]|nr:hypothetical protein [Kiritimatiellia bacterium]